MDGPEFNEKEKDLAIRSGLPGLFLLKGFIRRRDSTGRR